MRFGLKIHGPIRGGKNHIGITRTGKRYPLKAWAAWRDQVVREIREVCKPTEETMIKKSCSIEVIYTPHDLKRRDTPAMLDSIYHCLERAGIVEDDSLFQEVHWFSNPKNIRNSGASIVIEELP